MFFIKNYFAIFEPSVKRTLVNDTFSITFNNGKMNEEINMQEAEKNRDKATKSRIGYLFGIIMLLIYLTMAYLLAFTPISKRHSILLYVIFSRLSSLLMPSFEGIDLSKDNQIYTGVI